MQKVTVWLHNSCLTLNLEKPVKDCPDVSINGQTINNVDKFKYLGVTLEPTLSFKKHVKKRRNTLKYNLADVRYIRYSLKVEAVSDYVSECPHALFCYFTYFLLSIQNCMYYSTNLAREYRWKIAIC